MQTKNKSFTKIIKPGYIIENDIAHPVYIKIHYDNKKLSISGVIHPYSSGDAWGSYGQILDELKHLTPNKKQFYTKQTISTLYTYWKNHHLNDLHSECKHQRKEKLYLKNLTVNEYIQTNKTFADIRKLKSEIITHAKNNTTKKLTPNEQQLLSLPVSLYEKDLTTKNKPFYKLKKTEIKTAGWVTQNQHHEGMLSRPCPICNHKYGSSWLFVPVPKKVRDWLENLPTTDTTPTWV